MRDLTKILLVLGMCGVLLMIGLLRERAEWLLNIVMRGILGTIAMYFANFLLEGAGIASGVGINIVTVLTSGILGFPGLMALYAIGAYKML